MPTSLAVVDTHVFFVSRNVLYRCNASPTCTPVAVDSPETGVFGVRAFGSDVYWTVSAAGGTAGNVKKCAAASCTAPIVVADGGNPRDVAVRDRWLYVLDGGTDRPGAGSIVRFALP